ncbi:hypothetical protein HNR60_001596 [Rhodopseudomonas rhenobacensis]|uniref:Uncharacterized protein n=1 Tax=Rhodopseudomonas rhenobacensis TaxID=87461 RepID=A0A7W8DYH6_9BRAD|nr:hypothetical protein [Rhodopseudomonas rhenobacensis]MBB5046847.1 hypothetical protein [Rhodopseudomonas rhenobacensis]
MEKVVIGDATLFCGDAIKIMPSLRADVLITDPVWPNCPADLLAGGDDPYALWMQAMAAMPRSVERLVAVLRCDSDPRFLVDVPHRLRFFRTALLPYVMPHYIGRVLGGDEIAYCYGDPVAPARHPRSCPGGAARKSAAERTSVLAGAVTF